MPKKITPQKSDGSKAFVQTRVRHDDDVFGELAVDVFQTADEIVVVSPVAGVQADDIAVSVTEGVLTISGSRGFEFNIDERDYVSKECFWGSFKRSIILPEYVDPAGIKATYKEGILTVRIPKVEPVKTRMVQIES
ncbi:heat-shock protein Hsp20 [Candidatus Peregrinibacteria bacterium CG11_big_fil_rev_8_21_14_0_20_46_8]|nr:MAG: heat-shock protein Hsp20 [Candidatus Peregrinibacteria bacterium CG11_big_fil_rev_8_21_14_0_20_46_8]